MELKETNFAFDGQTAFYKGKVRDVYTIRDKYLLMVATDRISAFDVVLPRAIPYKGQVLNQIAARMLDATNDIVQNWVLAVPDEMATLGLMCTPYKVEMVVRGYLAGHAWREYKAGKRQLCGVNLPEGLKENDILPEPIITPTTKASEGHDEDISREELIAQCIVPENEYAKLEQLSLALFHRGSELAAAQGLILVDTKYEFGSYEGEIMLMDEIHTPDSSRYFYADTYTSLQAAGEPQRQLSKEFVRQWLLDNGFSGQAGQVCPEMTDEIVRNISDRYIELYEKITGEAFIKHSSGDIAGRILLNSKKALSKLQ